MEYKTLGLFAAALLICLIGDLSIIYALIAGLFIFGYYAYRQNFSIKRILQMYLRGLSSAGNILITFAFIGTLTAIWRASGTLAALVCSASDFIHPSIFYLVVFILNCIVSYLTGTAFGTAATMGSVCASIAVTMGASPLITGGAVLSGSYFGDRCSPVSTSAMLVADVTKTDVQDNIPGMFKTSLVPFTAAGILYLLPGIFLHPEAASSDLIPVLADWFQVRLILLLPALVILVLPLLHVRTKTTIFCSILSAVPLCIFMQHMSAGEIIKTAFLGYTCSSPRLSALMSGGGIVSMLKAAGIVGISSCYSGVFRETKLLTGFRRNIQRFSDRTAPSIAMLVVSVIVSAVTCNQTLSIMLTHQLCAETELSSRDEALDMENTVVVIAPLIPWSLACVMPLTAISAPAASVLFAFYLYILPVWNAIRAHI